MGSIDRGKPSVVRNIFKLQYTYNNSTMSRGKISTTWLWIVPKRLQIISTASMYQLQLSKVRNYLLHHLRSH
jgi:hypothetical protein